VKRLVLGGENTGKTQILGKVILFANYPRDTGV